MTTSDTNASGADAQVKQRGRGRRRTRELTFIVTVRVPADTSITEARQEVRTRLYGVCCHHLWSHEMKPLHVSRAALSQATKDDSHG